MFISSLTEVTYPIPLTKPKQFCSFINYARTNYR